MKPTETNLEPAQTADIPWIFELAMKNSRKNVEDPSQGFIQGAESPRAYEHWVATGSLFLLTKAGKNAGFMVLQRTNEPAVKGPAIVQYLFAHEETLSFRGKTLKHTRWTM